MVPTLSFGQDLLKFNPSTHVYEATQVVSMDSITANVLYERAMEWVALNYKSAKDVVRYANAEGRKIIVKGNFPIFMFLKEGWIQHTLTLEFKDGRYKYSYNNMSYYSDGSGEVPLESSMISKKKLLQRTNQEITLSVENMNAYLKAGTPKGNW